MQTKGALHEQAAAMGIPLRETRRERDVHASLNSITFIPALRRNPMKMLIKSLALLATLFLVTTSAFAQAGITTTTRTGDNIPVVDSVPANQKDTTQYATLYFYRSYIPKMNAPIKKVPIYINDTLVHSLKANTILTVRLTREGKYNIAIDDKGETLIPLRVKYGKEYFYRCEVALGLWFGKPTIQPVTPAVGRKESGMLESEVAKKSGR